ncbi:MAG: hypothetical protein L0H55_10705 [Candidatus Nitrosocosmicus sp.]|nr:hypothetical protein [Candidatus Nitrosocosmicus sp.]
MVNIRDLAVGILDKNPNDKAGNENVYCVTNTLFTDNGEVDTIGFAVDKENLKILRAKINAMLMDDDKPNRNK